MSFAFLKLVQLDFSRGSQTLYVNFHPHPAVRWGVFCVFETRTWGGCSQEGKGAVGLRGHGGEGSLSVGGEVEAGG